MEAVLELPVLAEVVLTSEVEVLVEVLVEVVVKALIEVLVEIVVEGPTLLLELADNVDGT